EVFAFSLNGRYDSSFLKTITVVGTGESILKDVNNREKTSRNCSSRTPTCRISFSLALPSIRKFFERTLVHLSFADTGAEEQTTPRKQKAIARTIARRFVIWFSVLAKPESETVKQRTAH